MAKTQKRGWHYLEYSAECTKCHHTWDGLINPLCVEKDFLAACAKCGKDNELLLCPKCGKNGGKIIRLEKEEKEEEQEIKTTRG